VIKVLSDMMTKPQLVGVDLADLRWLLGQQDSGGRPAVCGHGMASGPDRAIKAAEAALADFEDQLGALRSSKAS